MPYLAQPGYGSSSQPYAGNVEADGVVSSQAASPNGASTAGIPHRPRPAFEAGARQTAYLAATADTFQEKPNGTYVPGEASGPISSPRQAQPATLGCASSAHVCLLACVCSFTR
jgi:hypothetical protein